jgi:hypothetical protein
MKPIGNTLIIVLFALLTLSSLSIHLFKSNQLYYQNTLDDEHLVVFSELEGCLHKYRDYLQQHQNKLFVSQHCKQLTCINDYHSMLNIFTQSLSWWQQNAMQCTKQNWVYRDLLLHTPENGEYLYRISVYNIKHMLLTATFHRSKHQNSLQEISWFQSALPQ